MSIGGTHGGWHPWWGAAGGGIRTTGKVAVFGIIGSRPLETWKSFAGSSKYFFRRPFLPNLSGSSAADEGEGEDELVLEPLIGPQVVGAIWRLRF